MRVEGGCHCGRIAYEAEVDPERVVICHCADCQTLTGSPFRVTVATVPGTFLLTRGEPRIYLKTTADSGRARRHGFCGECGTPLFAAPEGPSDEISLRVGSISQRAALRPTRQIWCRSAVEWVPDLDLPATPGQ
jgi:hypothetical protein